MPIKRGDPWSEQDIKYSSKPVVVIRPFPIDPTRQREIANGIVKPKMNR